MASVSVREINPSSDLIPFVNFPYRLYKGHPYWIPPIKRMEISQFDRNQNPVLPHCVQKLWVAEKEGRITGRIGCFINDLETQKRGEKHARFNWLEFEDDPMTSRALLEIAADWAKGQGAVRLKGPLGYSNLESAGMTIEGFDELGTMGAPFHFPYYRKHLEEAGFDKLYDYLESVVEQVPAEIPEKLKRLQPIIEERFGIRQLPIGSKAVFEKRAKEVFYLVLDTYKKLPSFVPISDKQIDHYLAQNIAFLLPEYLAILENAEGQLIGYGVMMPSFSKALIRANGRLFPFGLLHLLWTRRFHHTVDLLLIGVVEEWRNKGLNALIFGNTIPVFKKNGVKKVYTNPVLEENQASQALFKDYGPREYRRRRVFVKEL
ncbi:MAG: hypothetical protein IPL49_12245 [Saprospirales bacterium]|nr:hypothetical protein [Saprospirales bacterium]